MIQFQENTQTDSTAEEWTDPISYDHFHYYWGSSKYNCSKLTLKLKYIEKIFPEIMTLSCTTSYGILAPC